MILPAVTAVDIILQAVTAVDIILQAVTDVDIILQAVTAVQYKIASSYSCVISSYSCVISSYSCVIYCKQIQLCDIILYYSYNCAILYHKWLKLCDNSATSYSHDILQAVTAMCDIIYYRQLQI